MATLTVIGETYAKKGAAFTYEGETDEGCAACKLRKVCQDLTPNRSYRVTNVRPVKHDVCHVFEGLVQIVEVEPLPVTMNIGVAKLRGTMVSNTFEECGAICLFHAQCNPKALPRGATRSAVREGQAGREASGGDAKIVKVGAPVTCLVGRELRSATVEPV
ncbi:MAG: UPF0179 family protein [Thermoplasmatota archaeon]